MSLEPLGTLPHVVTINKKGTFFPPITFGGLTIPPLGIFFQNFVVNFSAQVEATLGPGKPHPHRGFGQWGWHRDLSQLPWQQQQGREHCLPTGSAGARAGEQRGESWQLLSGITGHPLPSLLWAGAVWPFMPHVQLQEAEEGKNKWILCGTVTLISQA